MKEKILLHACCAPCSTVPIPALQQEGFDVDAFFFNPNIHPYSEFINRFKSMKQFIEEIGINCLFYTGYPLESFLRLQLSHLESRCASCYETRLSQTARKAREVGMRVFTTTLLVSPYQKHELIAEIGRNVEKETGVKFLYNDWRPRWRETRQLARTKGFYMQKYCGCIFSEAERHRGSRDPLL